MLSCLAHVGDDQQREGPRGELTSECFHLTECGIHDSSTRIVFELHEELAGRRPEQEVGLKSSSTSVGFRPFRPAGCWGRLQPVPEAILLKLPASLDFRPADPE